MLQRRRKLPQPNLGTFDGKFRKEHGEEPLRECFQQRAILPRADLDNPICHMRIVDRVVDVIRSRRRFSLALQFEVHRQRLRPSSLLRSNAAAPLKLQPFDDDLPSHGSILKDWISGCQYIVSGVYEGQRVSLRVSLGKHSWCDLAKSFWNFRALDMIATPWSVPASTSVTQGGS